MRSRQATSRLTCPARMSFTVINRFAMAHLHSHLAGHVSLDVACLDRIYLNGLLAHGAGARAGRAVLAAPRIPDPVSRGGGEDGPTKQRGPDSLWSAEPCYLLR